MSNSEVSKSTTTVYIISGFTIAYAILAGIPKIFVLFNPEAYEITKELTLAASNEAFVTIPFFFQLTHALLGIPVLITTGIFMIKGKEWALILFLIWIFGATFLTLLVSGFVFSFYAKLSVAMLIALLLLRPNTRKYFKG